MAILKLILDALEEDWADYAYDFIKDRQLYCRNTLIRVNLREICFVRAILTKKYNFPKLTVELPEGSLWSHFFLTTVFKTFLTLISALPILSLS